MDVLRTIIQSDPDTVGGDSDLDGLEVNEKDDDDDDDDDDDKDEKDDELDA